MNAPLLVFPVLDPSVGGKPSKTFAIGKMPARASFNVRIRLIKMVGEPVFRLFAGGKIAGLVAAAAPADGSPPAPDATDLKGTFDMLWTNPDAMAAVVRVLSANLDPDELDKITDVVFSACRCDGKEMSGSFLDVAFANLAPGALEKVLFAALKENYAGFFPAAA